MTTVIRNAWSTASWTRFCAVLLTFATIAPWPTAGQATLNDAHWIWSAQRRGQVSNSYFRKTFEVSGDTKGTMEITCDESYELFINGVKVATDDEWESIDSHIITPYLVPGKNAVTVAATKSDSGPAGLVAEITLTSADGQTRRLPTNSTWKSNVRSQAGWQLDDFDDSRWAGVRQIGKFETTKPWAGVARSQEKEQDARFQVAREFRVEWIVRPDDTGSLLAFEFNEFGHIIASQENGPLLLIRDTNSDGVHDKVSTYCAEIKNCQGILPLNGEVFATGDGPDGLALYRLQDADRDGVIDKMDPIVKFEGKASEHGPHAITLGPDGLIYVVVGNHTNLASEPRDTSPYRNFQEGDLVQPRLEDSEGYARGRPAPGGMILRTDTKGSFVERFAGGLRNPYDLVFNSLGDLLTTDSDMEWDNGLPWYRPTHLSHVTAGSEHGWRSGWAKWPSYYIDSVPPVAATGPGSPTGMAIYDHHMFPVRFHNTLFVGDWARGQIRALKIEEQGASYQATSSVFVEGSPLNVTDLTVGPEGSLYFSTGGRGTEGGIYRVVWLGRVPAEVRDRGTGIEAALKQPQPATAWGRQELATIKRELGNRWESELTKAARDRSRSSATRLRAMALMQLFGPFPSEELLLELSKDRSSLIRSSAAFLMGIHESDATTDRLIELLGDPSERVARLACESLSRIAVPAPAESLIPLLGSPDRFLARAAATTLTMTPQDQWRGKILDAGDHGTFLTGSTAILSQSPDKQTCLAILDRCSEITGGFVADDDFVDLLRVCQLALMAGEIGTEDVPQLAAQLAAEFPAGDARMNRELVRILAHFKAREPSDRYLEYLRSEADLTEKIHVGLHAPYFIAGWDSDQRFEVLEFLAKSREQLGSASYGRYLDVVTRKFVEEMTDAERDRVLEQGHRWPSATLGAIAKLPKQLTADARDRLIRLDEAMLKIETPASNRLRTGLVAVLARHGDSESMTYLRDCFDAEPNRRGILAVGLAQNPHGDNWDMLVRSLSVVEGKFANEVIRRLAKASQKPSEAESIRQLILQGLKQENDAGRRNAIALLEHWTNSEAENSELTPQQEILAWQAWFRESYPNEQDPVVPQDDEQARYTFQELYRHLSDRDGHGGRADHGKLVFSQAKCASCHRYGSQGEELGPDLSTISRRFHTKEILESIVYPSHIISDRYETQTVYTLDGRSYSGIVQTSSNGDLTILQSDGEKITVAKSEIEETVQDKTSTMPSGLLDTLTKQQIADLFAYLTEVPSAKISERPSRSQRKSQQ